MKGLKQTRLSFAPVAKGETSTREGQTAAATTLVDSTDSPAKTPRAKKAPQATNGRGRGKSLVFVEIPQPVKRSSRIRNSPTKPAMKAPVVSPKQTRKPSLKRKLSTSPIPYAERPKDGVSLPDLSELSSITDSEPKDASSRPSPPKRIRLSSSVSDLSSLTSSSAFEVDPDELVPTSQSDEQELTLPRIAERDPDAVKEHVAKWRKDTHANPPSRTQSPPPLDPICTDFEDSAMDVDAEPVEGTSEQPSTSSLPYPQTPRSSSGGSSHQQRIDAALATVTRKTTFVAPISPAATPTRAAPITIGSSSDAFSSLTPPPSSDPISGPEPEEEPQVIKPLDMKSKTDQLIADIKARAYAAAHSSPEQSPLRLDELSDSDSDSDSSDMRGGFAAVLAKGAKGKGKAKDAATPSQAGPSGPEPASAPRYNLRRVSPNNAKKHIGTPLTQQRKPSKANPLDSLLREKAREERTGMGMYAIRSAEAAFAKAKEDAKNNLKEEMADEEGSDGDDDWRTAIDLLGAAARGAKKTRAARSKTPKSTDEDADASGNEDDEASGQPDSETNNRPKGGKAVGQILENDIRDEKARALAKLNAEPVGVPLWAAAPASADDNMDQDFSMPPFPVDDGANGVLQLLGAAARESDVTQVSALLASGLVTVLKPDQCKSVIPWLFDLVFSNVPATLSGLAYTQLMRVAPMLQGHSSGLQPSSISLALIRLGASPSALEAVGWNVPHAPKVAFDVAQRDEMIYRLVSLLGAYAHASQGETLRDFFLAAVLVGMDPATSDDLVVHIHTTCDAIGIAIEAAQGNTFDLEASLCEMVVRFGKPQSPPNQARLISLFPCSSPVTTRMARNISRSLLMDNASSSRGYEKLPDLSPVVDLLSPPVGSGAHFDVHGNTDKEGFYDALASRVTLLSRVLSDIDEYTSLEVQAAKEKASKRKEHGVQDGAEQNGEKGKEEEPPSIIEQIRTQLEMLHGRIVDTRAAHLDRSRAKAAIQRLNHRVHYQRTAALKSGSKSGKPRTLRAYYHPTAS